ncbi:MAG: glycosyltransferase [Acidobacteria bacterium]|nr:glycosyltransferase [Acidobacteriota bacterium]
MEPSFLLEVIGQLPRTLLDMPSRVGPWLSAAARIRGRRVVYSPYLRAALSSASIEQTWGASDLGAVHVFANLLGGRALWSPHLSLSMTGGLAPRDPSVEPRPLAAPDLFVESYAAWLEADRLVRRLTRPRVEGPRPTVAILTSVWSRSPAGFFAETVDCVLRQTVPPDEWIILRNGPVVDDVASEIARAATAPFVRVIDVAENVGIIGAMRVCLDAATADFVLPLDSDDLLEDDALEVLAAWAAAEDADLVFSDEDHLTNGVLDHPFLRPGFDAVLHTESAYIWHACLVRRKLAVSAGAYQDAGAEYSHDWDTILRTSAAGRRLVHVPHLLYHWRTHPASHSNSGQQHPGTLASTRHLLEQTIARTSCPEKYRVAAFPRDRGLQEWYIERVAERLTDCLFVRVSDPYSPADSALTLDMPGRIMTIACGGAFSESLVQALVELPADALVCLAAAGITQIDAAGIRDAIKLFELHPAVEVVGGRTLDASRCVIESGRVYVDQGTWVDPLAGRSAADPGPFALALKAHCIDRPAAGLMVVRASRLRDLLVHGAITTLEDLSDACAAACLAGGTSIAYTPLLEGKVLQPAAGRPSVLADTRRLRERARALDYVGQLPIRHGAAALTLYRMRRRLA